MSWQYQETLSVRCFVRGTNAGADVLQSRASLKLSSSDSRAIPYWNGKLTSDSSALRMPESRSGHAAHRGFPRPHFG